MKAEINNENKAKFFALYLNQEVLCINFRKREILNKTWNWSHPSFWLSLKPLSSISDEDAVELGYSTCNDPLNPNYGMSASGCFFDDWTQREEMLMSDSDYLRSKGYALPWMGLSVEEMVQAGWIKLIK